VPRTMSGPPPRPPGSGAVGDQRQAPGRPHAPFSRSPAILEIELKDLDALFDRSSPPTYPHTATMVNRNVATFLVDSARERRRRSALEVVVAFQCPPLSSEEEAKAKEQMRRHFAQEAELADLARKVNRVEALGSAQYAVPLVILAGLFAGVLYSWLFSNPVEASPREFAAMLAYLVFITIVWVMLWDPLEKLFFESYMIRQRVRAFRKLAAARVTFVYGTALGGNPASGNR